MRGTKTYNSDSSSTNLSDMQMDQRLRKMWTAIPVRVTAVSPPHFVDVLPLVAQVDGAGNVLPMVAYHRLPYSRIQGGKNALVIDPRPGDMGWAVFCQRDITVVKNTRPQTAVQPGSFRHHDPSDGIYLGGMLNDEPERYVRVDDGGVAVEGVARIAMHGADTEIRAERSCTVYAAGGCTIHGDVLIDGSLTWTGTAQGQGGAARFRGGLVNDGGQVISNGVALEEHAHGGVQPGTGRTGEPS